MNLMGLNERKMRILEAIINDYIATAQPIGSRTIAKKYGLGISSATIRNEMSDLEDMGLIVQPHASAGRIPSDLGYRLYVDSLMRFRELTSDESQLLQNLIGDNIAQIDYLMQETAKAISVITKYTTVITETPSERVTIKHVQLVPVDESQFALVIVTDDKAVKSYTLRVANVPPYEELLFITKILNNHIAGCEGIRTNIMNILAVEIPKWEYIWRPVVELLAHEQNKRDDIRLYTSGVKNLLGFPEFEDVNKAKAVVSALEERELLITLMESGQENLSIIIGSENTMQTLRDCSIIKADYGQNGNKLGSIGIIGPTRMEYSQVASMLLGIVNYINYVINTLKGGG